MRINATSLTTLLFAIGILALSVDLNVEAFVKGTVTTRTSPASLFELNAAAPKKKKQKKKKAASKSDVETFRKPDFVASVAEKLDTSKAGAEEALSAVLETISEVSLVWTIRVLWLYVYL